MKKKSLFVAVLVLMVCLTIPRSIKKSAGTGILMQNIEALADPDVQEVQKTEICWTTLVFDPQTGTPSSTIYCGTCTELPYTHREDQMICKNKKK